MRSPVRQDQGLSAPQGFVLVIVLMWLGLAGALALGVALATAVEPLASSAIRDRVRLRRAAESAATLALIELAGRSDWSALPSAGTTSSFTDGAPGPRLLGGRTIDVVGETHLRTCGRLSACDAGATSAASAARPWGPANPRWRLFVHVKFERVDPLADRMCDCYLVAWIADDPSDADGDPTVDAPLGTPGHGVLWVRGAAFDASGGLAEVEATVAQPCRISGATCEGIRVQSWRAVHERVP